MFDPTKPVQTRDGRKARIICTDKAGDRPIVALVGDKEETWTFRKDGSMGNPTHYPGCIDLVNIPQRHKHYDLIVKWAEEPGKYDVECRHHGQHNWGHSDSPSWYTHYDYRLIEK